MANEPLDDFEDDNDFDQDGFKWMSMIVLVLAVTGFFSLAWYAYQNSTQHLRIEDVLIVEADEAPIKRAPEEAGGMEFPHKDKEIYALLDEKGGDSIGGTGKAKAAVEEEAVDFDAVEEAKAEAEAAPKKADRSATIEKLFDESDAKAAAIEAKAARLKAEMQAKADAEAAKAKAAAEAEAETAKKEEKVATYIKPTPKAKPAPVKTPEPFTAPTKNEPKELPPVVENPAPTPVKKVEAPKTIVGSGDYSGYAVQLGAVRSESEAEGLWRKVSNSHVDLLGDKGYKIVRADLGDKGVFYRLRVGGLSSAEDAKALCAQLAARSQGCFPAGKI